MTESTDNENENENENEMPIQRPEVLLNVCWDCSTDLVPHLSNACMTCPNCMMHLHDTIFEMIHRRVLSITRINHEVALVKINKLPRTFGVMYFVRGKS